MAPKQFFVKYKLSNSITLLSRIAKIRFRFKYKAFDLYFRNIKQSLTAVCIKFHASVTEFFDEELI